MKRVITCGVFDYFHYGHLRLLKNAKKEGDYLIVAVQDNDYILQFKPEARICYSTEQRLEMISELRVVDEVCVYTSIDSLLPTVEFDIFAIGEDQNHEGFKKAVRWCKENNKKVVRMHRTAGISSSQIKDQVFK